MLKAIHLLEDKENISVQTPIHIQSSDDDRVNFKEMNEVSDKSNWFLNRDCFKCLIFVYYTVDC